MCKMTSFRQLKKHTTKRVLLKKCLLHLAENFVFPTLVMGETDQALRSLSTLSAAIIDQNRAEVPPQEMQDFHKNALQLNVSAKRKKKKGVFKFFNENKQAKRIRLSKRPRHTMQTTHDDVRNEKVFAKCVCCNVPGGPGHKTNVRSTSWCSTCGVFLCTKKNGAARKTCEEKWHEQRVMRHHCVTPILFL